MVHPSREIALELARSYSSGTSEDIEAVATYAFEHQVAIFHAGWALAVKHGHAGYCTCAACEREGYTARIHAATRAAWGAKAEEMDAAHRPVTEWLDTVNEAAAQATLIESVVVLNELEATYPQVELAL